MSTPIIITLVTLAILAFISIGGVISSKEITTESTFFSIGQTNWLRSIAILMVMFSHYYPVLGLTYSDGAISFCMNFGYMGVAIFFLLSGYSMMISLIKKPNYIQGFIPKRLLRIYVPFLIVFVLSIILILVMGQGIKGEDFLFMPLMSLPGTLNWYLKIQLCLYILFYILAKVIKNYNLMIGTMFSVCIIYMLIGYYTNITAFWYETVFAFPIGMLLANKKELIYSILNKRYYLALPISLIVFIVCLAPYYLKGGTLFEIVYILGLLQFIICFCAKFCGSVLSRVFTYLGTISLELYLVHVIIINNVFKDGMMINYNLTINVIVFFVYCIASIIVGKTVELMSKRIIRKISI